MLAVLPSFLITDLSRLQFAFTALFHFMFVPLTLGLTWILVVMEAAYLKTGKEVYKDMTKFWGKLLGINFAIGVISGITMEFEFGLNWSFFSRMIGGSFGPILAIEGITAFMLEATMFGLFFFTWNKVSKVTHFVITFFMAFGASLSIVNILAANSWMQHMVATTLNPINMTLELHSIAALYLNFLAQIRIGHVAYAGFLVSSIFVMGISAYYLLKNQDSTFARRSFSVGVGFALIVSVMVFFFGDQNGLEVAQNEPEKMAAIEGQWETQKPPAAWYLVAIPHQKEQKNTFVIKIPYMLSLIATHSLTGTVEGIKPIIQGYKQNVKNGIIAYKTMEKIKKGTATSRDKVLFKENRDNIGYGLLLNRFTNNIPAATSQQIAKAATYAIPQVSVVFWSFRIMLGIWGILFLLIVLGFIYTLKGTLAKHRFYLRSVLYAIPLPFIAAEFGWVLAEVGRQPWVVHQILPTFWGTSSISLTAIITSLIFFFLFYATLYSVELFLMFKYARRGPSSLGTGKYHFEKQTSRDQGEKAHD